MIEYIRARLREKSTYAGFVAIALGVSLLIIPMIMPADAAALTSQNVQWLITALFASGLGGIIWHRKV
jgi:hypothetical protein